MKQSQQGVTLVELMVVVAIVATLAAIAYPSYRNQLMRSHRAEAKAALLQIQVAQEKYFLQNNSYGTLVQLVPASLGLKSSGSNYVTTNGYYKISFLSQNATSYQANADTQSSQADDTHCAQFTITETGSRGATSSDCW